MKQSNFELQHTKSMQHRQYDEDDVENFISPCMTKLYSLVNKDIPLDRADLEEVSIVRGELDYEEVMWKLFHTIIFSEGVTVQQLLGLYWNQLDMEIGQRKAKVMEPFFIALTASPHISATKKGVEFIFSSDIEVNSDGYGYVLPSLDLPIVLSNDDIGYTHTKEHVITGHSLKHHDLEVCLDHINRLNAVAYRTETRLLAIRKPTFSFAPKLKKQTAKLETLLEVEKRKESFLHYSTGLPEKIRIMVKQGNKFHICHKYDNRLRTYAKAYHFDYIGNKYSRALVQPYLGEITEGSNEYF
jgi:hypothetical protein